MMAADSSDNSREDKLQENNIEKTLSPAQERSEYFEKLEKWLHEAYAWQSVASMFPPHVLPGQVLPPSAGIPFVSIPTVINTSQYTNPQNDGLRQRRPQEATGQFHPAGAEGFEYRIPPLWKRFAAEFIDSAMLFLLKFCITYIAIDVFDFINIEDLDVLEVNLHLDYKMALEITYGILILETIHRVIVCIFEAFWLQHGMNGRLGGATPGKSLLGLKVVQCRNVTPIERQGETGLVLISPGTDLGLPLALGRSVIKNLIIAFLFPICFALFYFRFHRTVYDLVSNSIVVEDSYRNTNNNRLHR